jgi:hypothetical protein
MHTKYSISSDLPCAINKKAYINQLEGEKHDTGFSNSVISLGTQAFAKTGMQRRCYNHARQTRYLKILLAGRMNE